MGDVDRGATRYTFNFPSIESTSVFPIIAPTSIFTPRDGVAVLRITVESQGLAPAGETTSRTCRSPFASKYFFVPASNSSQYRA